VLNWPDATLRLEETMTTDDPADTWATHPWVAEAGQTVRFGLVGGPFPQWPQTLEFVQQAEEMGIDAYCANDHPTRAMDCWATLVALAVTTKKIRLLSLVSCLYYRSPLLLARMAADVDRLSDGRLVLGIGIGDDTAEFAQLRLPFPPTKERQEALEETIQVVRGLWGPAPFAYQGRHVQLEEARVSPRPVQTPRVPLLIGGGGERVTLRQVAQYADMANFGPHEWAGSAYNLGDVQRKLAALRRHCEEQHRPYESVLRSHYTPLLVLAETPAALQAKQQIIRVNPNERQVPLFATPREAVAHYQALLDAGMQYFLAYIRGNDVETVRLLAGQVMPALRPSAEAASSG
jgi:alkanesulfonate monooxygenase SsuD/methylene tetrahydromethanopterin reductase-like flavin-dependent oxidoreductase (luciferase family)